MKSFNPKFFLSVLCLCSIMSALSNSVIAAPVQYNQVVQVVNAKPGRAGNGGFSQLRLADGGTVTVVGGDDDKKPAAPQDDRVITETRVEIVEDDVCDCVEEQIIRRGFPKWALLGFAAVPLLFLFKDKTPTNRTPTPTPPTTETPTPTTPTPTTPTPMTPTPTPPEPVPEPMTILLFGTGLAGIGIAARKRFGKKDKIDIQS